MNVIFSNNDRILCLSCNVIKPKTTAKLSKKSRNKLRSNNLFIVSSVKSALILLLLFIVAQHESGTRKTIFWSVTVYNKNLSSQCNLTAQIKPVQDKHIYIFDCTSFYIKQLSLILKGMSELLTICSHNSRLYSLVYSINKFIV